MKGKKLPIHTFHSNNNRVLFAIIHDHHYMNTDIIR